jgi:hypothetical protein
MKRLFVAVSLACTLVGSIACIQAAEKAADAPKSEKKAKHIPFRGKVTAVTVTLAGKEKDRVFSITSQTRFNKDGKPAVLDEVKAGESVSGSYVEAEGGKMEVLTLNIGKKGAEPKPEGEKPKKDKPQAAQ